MVCVKCRTDFRTAGELKEHKLTCGRPNAVTIQAVPQPLTNPEIKTALGVVTKADEIEMKKKADLVEMVVVRGIANKATAQKWPKGKLIDELNAFVPEDAEGEPEIQETFEG